MLLWDKNKFVGTVDKAKKVLAVLQDEKLYLENELKKLKEREVVLKDFIEKE
jgi:hypothetical protein